MVKLGLGVLAIAIVKALLVITLTIAGAAALTHYVALPEPLGTLVWILAIGYSLLCVATVVIMVAALAAGGVATSAVRTPAPKRVVGRRHR